MRRCVSTLLVLAAITAACATDSTSVATDASTSTAPAGSNGALPDGPSALRDGAEAPGLPEPLVDGASIRSGGPPPDGIPSIDEPTFAPIDEIDFLADVEPVLLLEVGDDVKIYPVQIMTWHELVNDTIAGVPVTVSFCPLCNSAIAYDRRVDGAVLSFGTSGSLYNSAMVMYDRQTESLWSHYSSTAIAGVLTGVELDRFPVATVSWADAKAATPDALVLTRDTGHSRDYGRNPYGGYDDVGTHPFLFDGDVDGRLAAKERIIGIEGSTDAVAVRLEQLRPHDVVDVDVDGVELTVWRKPGTASSLDAERIADGRDIGATGVFDRTLDGVTFSFTPGSDGTFVDEQTASTWDITGRAIAGELVGTRLAPVHHVDTFWFAWAAFLPDTTIV